MTKLVIPFRGTGKVNATTETTLYDQFGNALPISVSQANVTLSSATITTTALPTITGNVTFADGTTDVNIASHDGTNGLKLGGTLVTSSAAELNYLDIATLGTGAASKAVVLDASGDYTYPASATLVHPSGATETHSSGSTVNIAGTFQIGGTAVGATASEINNAADVSARTQELTVTGAVTAGVQSVELNHATVVVAATIANANTHQGLFIVKNTSASGTAAHTLTLTAGTFNGTNNVATLNAPNEALVVYFDSAGNGTIIENVGAVALS